MDGSPWPKLSIEILTDSAVKDSVFPALATEGRVDMGILHVEVKIGDPCGTEISRCQWHDSRF